jgi:general secretion pathway protein B
MSYILDALKRADAERQRGTVPGLHARQLTTPASQAASARSRLWLAAGAALVLGGMAAGLWVWRTPAGGARLAAADVTLARTAASAPLSQPVPTPKPMPASAPAPQSAVPALRAVASLPSAVTPTAQKPVSKQVLAAPAVGAQAPPKPKLDPVAKAAVQGAPAPATPMPLPAAKDSASQAALAVPLLSELSEDIRRQIPALAITGAVYSENPGQRLLLVNKQVLTQGSLAAPEVNLEEIRAQSSVFSFRGTRFRVAH